MRWLRIKKEAINPMVIEAFTTYVVAQVRVKRFSVDADAARHILNLTDASVAQNRLEELKASYSFTADYAKVLVQVDPFELANVHKEAAHEAITELYDQVRLSMLEVREDKIIVPMFDGRLEIEYILMISHNGETTTYSTDRLEEILGWINQLKEVLGDVD